MENITVYKGDFLITTDKTKLDMNAIHDFLSTQSYWAKNITMERVKLAAGNSLSFGLFHLDKQIGYARIISDYATVAYLGDVYVLKEYRGKGLSKWLMEQVKAHPKLQDLRRWILLTADAHELYKKYGFTAIEKPERYMELFNPNVYTNDGR